MARHPDFPGCWKCSVCGVPTYKGNGYCSEHYAIEKKRSDEVEERIKRLAIANADYERDHFINMSVDEKLLYLYDHIFGD